MKLEDLTPRMRVALEAMAEHSDVAEEASAENGWHQPQRRAYAYHVVPALAAAGLEAAGHRRRRETGAANTLIALRRRGLVAGGSGMAFDSTWWWITPEGATVLRGKPPEGWRYVNASWPNGEGPFIERVPE